MICSKMNEGKLAVPLLIITLLALAVSAAAKPLPGIQSKQTTSLALDNPNLQLGVHATGNMAMSVTNFGVLGTGFIGPTDCDGQPCPSCEFPIDSDIEYLYAGSYWISAVVGTDTLASVAGDGWFGVYELYPDSGDDGEMLVRSTDVGSPFYSVDAVALLDYIAECTDTLDDPAVTGTDPTDGRDHLPFYVELRQQSYSWADPGIDDFILFECYLKNFGVLPLTDVWVGIYMDCDIAHATNFSGYMDDVTGYLPSEQMAYITDNDGDPDFGAWIPESPRGAFGVKYHGSDPATNRINYNWWISDAGVTLDFGPRLAGTAEDPFRPFTYDQLGTPTGDANKHYILSHAETDYDQLFTAVSHAGEGFLPPPAALYAENLADGYDTRFLLSFGPFDIAAGDSVQFVYSVVMGNNIHVGPTDFLDNFDPATPQPFYDLLDFSDLTANAAAADSVVDELFDLPVDADDYGGPPRPTAFSLGNNYPNPFNPATTIAYTLPRQTHVELAVFNLLGQKIATLVDRSLTAGGHRAVWDGRDDEGRPAASGIYFYRLMTETESQAKKMLLLK